MDVNFVFEKGKVIPLSLSRGKDGVLGRYAFRVNMAWITYRGFRQEGLLLLEGKRGGGGQERAFVYEMQFFLSMDGGNRGEIRMGFCSPACVYGNARKEEERDRVPCPNISYILCSLFSLPL